MPEGILCNKKTVDTKEYLDALLADRRGAKYYEEMKNLDVDKEKLKNAPGFDKDSWPDMANTTWGENIHKFYGQTYSPTDWQR